MTGMSRTPLAGPPGDAAYTGNAGAWGIRRCKGQKRVRGDERRVEK